MNYCALQAALCDLGDPGWEDPWFPHRLCCFSHPFVWPGVASFSRFSVLFVVFGGHTKCDDTMLSPLVSIHGLIGYHHSPCFVLVVVFVWFAAVFLLCCFCFGSDGPL